MATYKAEFLSHWWAGRLRPPAAYAMGLIPFWARAAMLAPWAANALTHAPGLSQLVKLAGGLALDRELPRFAPRTFRRWFATHPPAHADGARVLLWPDTFNDHFHPDVAI